MNFDLKRAYEFATEEAKQPTKITPDFIKKLNALIMKNTGSLYHTALGSVDSGRGDYRLFGVRAGVDGASYMNYQEIPSRVENLCSGLQNQLAEVKDDFLKDVYNLSFDAN